MLDDKTRSEFEQGVAAVKEILPSIWWNVYKGCMTQGFTEPQAFELTKTYIMKNDYGGQS